MKTPPNIEQEFVVPFRYQVLFTQDLFGQDNPLLKEVFAPLRGPVKTLVVIDQGFLTHWPSFEKQIKAYFAKHSAEMQLQAILEVPGGEASKADDTQSNKVLKAIDDYHICRHSVVLAIGGGAVIDMAGFAAAIAHRGVKLIRIPTTVLAQNDAAVGVKNGINAFGKKNFIGSFALPFAIINDTQLLTTLEQRDWVAGIAEAVKVSLLQDAEFFHWIVANTKALAERSEEEMNELIYRCALLHTNHISQGGDPFESGSSRPLDFGHWSAHKMEQLTNYALRHGEAVALGICIDLAYARLKGFITATLFEEVLTMFTDLGFPMALPEGIEAGQLLNGLEEFREHLGGELTITLIKGAGHQYDVHEIDQVLMAQAIEVMKTPTLHRTS